MTRAGGAVLGRRRDLLEGDPDEFFDERAWEAVLALCRRVFERRFPEHVSVGEIRALVRVLSDGRENASGEREREADEDERDAPGP